MRKNIPSPPFPEILASFKESPENLLWKFPGIFLIDKPEGISSHKVVSILRRKFNIKKVGHGGTLDPLATGLLIAFAGNATRLFDQMQEYTKSYTAKVKLGLSTDTHDITGKTISESTIPELASDKLNITLEPFRGEIMQIPPMFSALKKDGKPLYKLARKGESIDLPPRPMSVHKLNGNIISEDTIELNMTVSKGFYVRSLIRDIGESLKCGACMTALRRTAIGPFKVNDACNPAEIPVPENLL
jgi:tRNA pseudouridine55 synthase